MKILVIVALFAFSPLSQAHSQGSWTLYLRAPSEQSQSPEKVLADMYTATGYPSFMISIDRIIAEEKKEYRIVSRIFNEIKKYIQRSQTRGNIGIQLPSSELLKRYPFVLRSLHQIASTKSIFQGDDEVWVKDAKFLIFVTVEDQEAVKQIQKLGDQTSLKEIIPATHLPAAFVMRMDSFALLSGDGCRNWLR